MPETLFGLHLMRPLWLLCAVPALLLTAMLWQQRGRAGGWSRVIAPELLRHLIPEQQQRRRSNLLLLVCAAWLLACIAAAGPSWKKIPQPVEQVEDALVLVLDLSYSMKATDQPPSRLDRARQKLLDLLATRREGQTGLVAYAGDAHVVTPLTDDTATIANLLPALNPDMMPLPGSDTLGALRLALELLQSAGVSGGRVLLLTDGVDEDEVPRMGRLVRSAGVTLSVLGLGTANGAPMPLPRGGFLRDDAGAIILPRLEEGPLEALAQAAGGRYQRLRVDDSDLDMLLAQAATATETRLAEGLTADAWEDQGYWLILLLLPLALALFRRGWLLGLLPLLLLLEPATVQAQPLQNLWLTPDQQARRALEAGDAERAAALFEDPAWAGTAAYAAGDYAAAAEHFQGPDSADGWYNRGNALARAGDLDGASEAYRRSLKLQPGREDAADNLALVEDLKQQQQEQEQKQEQQQEQQSGEDGEPQPDSGEDSEGQEQGQPQKQEQEAEPREQGEPDQGSPQDPSSGTQDEDEGTAEEDTGARESEPAQEPAAEQEPLTNIEVPELSLEEAERNQAMEQWLRRVPDDPSGLLREKFRYESRKRQQQPGSDNERDW
ncbi:VWA domain-containing protein [Haliea sp. E1-2-M8]|uniref:vWA domain-containing protein n=1 Tax=Haliea sp. E1-2-M8 TaxID=3064706 RepID=UPI00271CBDAC|nr:VWA domain-containing protein [Haliea sp. E1-2-M8]MDO8863058.1 VWA domain-containing protein [Haliea sp. E1-2-M8]